MIQEEVGLDLVFEETRLRGSKKYYCILRATELGTTAGCIEETISADSWKTFKKQYPTLKDILIELFPRDSWNPSWRNGERILFVDSINGHEGLYEFDESQRIEVDWDTEVKPDIDASFSRLKKTK